MRYAGQDMHWLIGSLSHIFHVPFDPQLIRQQFPPPYSRTALLNALQALAFKVGEFHLDNKSLSALEQISFPAIAFFKVQSFTAATIPAANNDASSASNNAAPTEWPPDEGAQAPAQENPLASSLTTPVLLIKADAERVLYFRAGSETPETLLLNEFLHHFQCDILLIARQDQTPTDPAEQHDASGTQAAKPPFGFRWFIPELMKHRSIWRDVLLASLMIQVAGLVTPLFTQVIIDKVVVHQIHSTLIAIAIGLVMFMLFSSAMTWLRQYFILHTGNRIDAVLGSQVFSHLLHLPAPYFEHRPTGTLVARMHGVETVREFISGAAVTLLLDFPFLLIFLAVMFWYSWQLSLIALLVMSMITLASLFVTPIFREKLNQQFMFGAKNQAFVTEYVAGIETVKSLQMEPILVQKYGDNLSQYLAAGFATKQLSNSFNVVVNALEQTMNMSILVVGALLVMKNDGFTIGMLVAFQMFAGRMSQPMLRLASLWQEFQQANIAIKRLGDLMDTPTEPHTLIPARAQVGAGGCVELKEVSFRYSDKHPYLYRNLNLTLKPGKLSVLMGASGCGKSTLAKILQGFYWPTDGCILLDGYDLRHLAANELRANFGVVPQETRLFSGTIYENLQLANPHVGFEEIVRVCKMAEIHNVIEQLPQGYQTPVGENGVGLSGGQKQRIAIARALLKRPRVLIFDEAVSNLDQPTAELFATTINQLKGHVTMLFITHQLPNGLQVDEVLTFDNQETSVPIVPQPQQSSTVQYDSAQPTDHSPALAV